MKCMHMIVVAMMTSVAIPAMAQDAAAPAAPAAEAPAALTLKPGMMVRSSDNRRVGSIDHINRGADGSPASVAIITSENRFAYIPVSTLTEPDKTHLVTSMTNKQIMDQ